MCACVPGSRGTCNYVRALHHAYALCPALCVRVAYDACMGYNLFMKTIHFLEPCPPPLPAILHEYFGPMPHYGVLDIETTGLSPAYASVILIGLIRVEGKHAEVFQFFAEEPGEEAALFAACARRLQDLSFVVTYNGRLFDLPFIQKRARAFDIALPPVYNLDLFAVLKGHSALPELLPDMRQKTVERFAGLENKREDRISGMESVKLYTAYLESGSYSVRDTILLHNRDDIGQLLHLLPLLGKAHVHRAFSFLGFPFQGGSVKNVRYYKRTLTVKGKFTKMRAVIIFPSAEHPYYLRGTDEVFTFELPCEEESGASYVDLMPLFPQGVPAVLKETAGYASGYLLLKTAENNLYREQNLLTRLLLTRIAAEYL